MNETTPDLDRYANPITPSDTILFALKQCRGNVINEAEYSEAEAHYKQLRDTQPDLLAACEAQLKCLTMDSDSEEDYAPEIAQARAAIAKARKGKEI